MADARARRARRGVIHTWKRLIFEQRVAAVGAVLLIVSTLGPFSFVEAAEVLIALAVLALLRARAESARFRLPVRDGTCGTGSYGGGRYLTDTVKGTHGRGVQLLGDSRVRLDMNYLYNPSCAYDDRWLCPLAPPENRVTTHLAAGEQTYFAG